MSGGEISLSESIIFENIAGRLDRRRAAELAAKPRRGA
jgi:hypothetical protein